MPTSLVGNYSSPVLCKSHSQTISFWFTVLFLKGSAKIFWLRAIEWNLIKLGEQRKNRAPCAGILHVGLLFLSRGNLNSSSRVWTPFSHNAPVCTAPGKHLNALFFHISEKILCVCVCLCSCVCVLCTWLWMGKYLNKTVCLASVLGDITLILCFLIWQLTDLNNSHAHTHPYIHLYVCSYIYVCVDVYINIYVTYCAELYDIYNKASINF